MYYVFLCAKQRIFVLFAQPTTIPEPEPDESSLHLRVPFLEDHL